MPGLEKRAPVGAVIKKETAPGQAAVADAKAVEIPTTVNVRDLAEMLRVSAVDIITGCRSIRLTVWFRISNNSQVRWNKLMYCSVGSFSKVI